MIIFCLANFATVENPTRWLYAAAVELLVIDSLAAAFILGAIIR